MLVEVEADHAVPWMEPTDADEAMILSLGGSEGATDHGHSANVVYADGEAKFLSLHPKQTPADLRRQLISIAGNDPPDAVVVD
jgi:prepilin-type processing-associated H-X9-DG protein